jgi:nonsense-mediated mRNA decay protein 3
MSIQESFCPKCGGASEGGLCGKCRAKQTEWLVCDPRISSVRCPTCESLKYGSRWTDTDRDHQEIAEELTLGAVHLHEDVRHPDIGIATRDMSPNRTMAQVTVAGTLYGVPVKDTCTIEIAWKKEQCDRCCMLAGGYYEGVLQLRATGRKPDPFEIGRGMAIARSVEDSMQEAGDRLSFITRTDETKDGLDIVVSSQHIGQRISREIVRELGGRVTTHPKLAGERDGKALYRVTYAIRLPCYQKGDVVVLDKRPYEIREMVSSAMKVFDLTDGSSRVIHEDCSGRLLGNIRQAEKALVAFLDGDIVGILDPKTFETREFPAPPWLAFSEGAEVLLLRDPEMERFIFVG